MIAVALAANSFCADLIFNEFCAVGSEKYLETDTYAGSTSVDLYFQAVADGNHPSKITGTLPNGRIQGNGSDWIELVVTKDHLDIRGWQIRWAELEATEADGTNIWYGNGNIEQGILTFSNNSVWSDLRAGTIITVVEEDIIYVDTDNGNLTYNVAPSQAEAIINVDTDTSFDPNNNDWWINVSVRGEAGRTNPLITSVHNVSGHIQWDFGVGNDSWQGQINDAGGNLVWGPVGEHLTASGGWGGTGLSSKEMGRLEADPSAAITGVDFDDADSSSFGMPNRWGTPVESDQNFMALRIWFYTPADCNAAINMGFGLTADFNKDCYVNFKDFADFAASWLDCVNPLDSTCQTPWLEQ